MIVDLNDSRYANMDEPTATHAMAEEITQLTAMRTNLKREVRSYEVSLWTLQDEFITVLKWSDAEQRGRIENPLMKLNVDGTQNLTFSIPMYLYIEEFDELNEHVSRLIKKENPIWYNTQNGNLMVGLNKIKVIFNKGEFSLSEASDHIFEFIIVKVSETHESDLLICNIECEGLAFHELGKIGYKISLSLDNFLLDKKSFDELGYWIKRDGTKIYTNPVENVLYWCEQCGLIPLPTNSNVLLNPAKWYYDILMNWGSFNGARSTKIIYENEYVSSWTEELVPLSLVSAREKYRPIDANESNIYNITLNIAETFEIYCYYKYLYDDNYHIIGRLVIFYNNYLNEENVLHFTYPYSTSLVTREMDVTDVTTKMYVKTLDNTAVVSEKITIADCPANKTKEDYILDFSYLHDIGAITEEQYNEIPIFEKNVRTINDEIEDLSLEIAALQEQKDKLSALAKVYEESCSLDSERLDYNSALYSNLDATDGEVDGYFTRGTANPFSTYVKTGTNGRHYITFSDENLGVDSNYLMVFRIFNSAKRTFKNRITDYTVIHDSLGFAKELVFNNFSESFTTDVHPINVNTSTNTWTATVDTSVTDTAISGSNTLVYLVYKYLPKLYYEKVNLIWLKKYKEDKDAYDVASTAAKNAETQLKVKEDLYNLKLKDKNNLILKFEHMMGPALREGFWQPDDYKDYGDNYTIDNLILNNYDANVLINAVEPETSAVIGWDETLFDEEEKLYFEESVLRTKVFYPCIVLSGTLLTRICSWLRYGLKPSFIFNNNYYKSLSNSELNAAQNLEIFTLGGSMRIGFIHQANSTTVLPVLILDGASLMTNELIRFMITSGNPKVGVVNISVDNLNKASITFGDNLTTLSTSDFYWDTSIVTGINNINNYSIVYPRIKISSNELNTSSILLKYLDNQLSEADKLLVNFTDYQILSRVTTRNSKAYLEYFITIKPELFFNKGRYINTFEITYTLSNAATCIYLDALDIMIDSAKPKVSYTVTVSALNVDYIQTAYKTLCLLVMINDAELKFLNTFGYISGLDLNLDAPWSDQIEVKNYKTKFEDLFSTIVASSEDLRKNGAAFNAAANGGVPLTSGALSNTLGQNELFLKDYLDMLYKSSDIVKAMLAELFTEAGTILASANESLDEVKNLNIKNSAILGGFIEKISANITPTVVTSITLPTKFKVGDVWNEVDSTGHIVGRYVATTNSDESSGGYTRTFDGSLAAIKGAKLDIDTVKGTINISAENEINIKSGGYLHLAGENVDIVGNKCVNIGGTTVNIATLTKDGNSYSAGGINLVAAGYTSTNFEGLKAAKVLIKPSKITMYSNEIEMLAGVSTDNAIGASAVRIGGQNGIWLGSSAGVTLYSGNVSATNPTGASVELKYDHLLFGVSNSNSGTAIKLTSEAMTLAVGTSGISSIETNGISGITGGSTGIRITKDFFGIASVSNNVMNAIIMNGNGVTLGSGAGGVNSLGLADISSASGSVVRISGNGIMLNSLAQLSVNTTNLILNSLPDTGGTVLRLGPSNNVALQYIPGSGLTVTGNLTATTLHVGSGDNSLTYENGTLTIKGSMTVSNGSTIAGWTVGTSALSANNGKVYLASSGTYAINCNDKFMVDFNGNVWMKALYVDGLYIDFTTAFNNAVSLWGAWNSDGEFNAYARFYGNTALTKNKKLSASVQVTAVHIDDVAYAPGYGNATVTLSLTIDGSTKSGITATLESIADSTVAYSLGWLKAISYIGQDYDGEKTLIIPSTNWGLQGSGLQGAGATTTFDISATYDNGYRAASGTVRFNGSASYSNTISITNSILVKVPYGLSTRTVTITTNSTGSCFSAGTLVKMADGTLKPVEKLVHGDMVMSYNNKENKCVPSEIISTFKHKNAHDIVDMYFSSGLVITATSDHPFLTNEGWKAIKPKYENTLELLHEGDQIKTFENEFITLDRIVLRPDLEGIPVYNCEIEKYHTYIVDHVIVHNAKDAE